MKNKSEILLMGDRILSRPQIDLEQTDSGPYMRTELKIKLR